MAPKLLYTWSHSYPLYPRSPKYFKIFIILELFNLWRSEQNIPTKLGLREGKFTLCHSLKGYPVPVIDPLSCLCRTNRKDLENCVHVGNFWYFVEIEHETHYLYFLTSWSEPTISDGIKLTNCIIISWNVCIWKYCWNK